MSIDETRHQGTSAAINDGGAGSGPDRARRNLFDQVALHQDVTAGQSFTLAVEDAHVAKDNLRGSLLLPQSLERRQGEEAESQDNGWGAV